MLRYAITDSAHYGSTFASRRAGLLSQARRLTQEGVDYIQLREKDLLASELFELCEVISPARLGSRTKLLVNARADVSATAHAAGVHLTSDAEELTPAQVHEVFAKAGRFAPVVSVSCHTLAEVQTAKAGGPDIILFGPVFEKRVNGLLIHEGSGLTLLREACATANDVPVLALGGVTQANTPACLEAGAAGIASIRLFL